jgi:hypothetical protein
MPEKAYRRRGKYSHLFDNPDIKRWYDNTSRGSRATADVYLRKLGAFCKQQNTNPERIIQLREGDIRNLLLDYVSWGEEQGFAGSYIESTIKAVKSWLAHNGKEIRTKIRIRGTSDTPSLRNERVPTNKELKEILLSGDKKTRAACVLVAHSGLRIGVLGNYRGDDGVRLKDLPEMAIGKGEVEFEDIPTVVAVRRELSKANHKYFSFLGEEGCGYVKAYLEERIRGGEKLEPESALITPKTSSNNFITSINIGDIIRQAIRGAGYSWRPYVLRAYFDTQLMLAENKGLVLRDYRQFWMGHKGDIENRYTTNKNILPTSVIEDMRESYKKSQQYLQTTQTQTSEEKIRDQLRHQLLLVAGFKEEEISTETINQLSDEEFQAMVRERLMGSMLNNGIRQTQVPIEKVKDYLSEGWEFVGVLPNNTAILKLPP